jgi:hypothetical protein
MDQYRKRVLGWLATVGLSVAMTTPLSWAGRTRTGTLFVFAADSSTGKPVRGVAVTVRRPGWYVSDTHEEPEWFADTDSTGWARLRKIPAGTYNANLCENTYEGRTVGVTIRSHKIDTLGVKMAYLGPPSDGRRCETHIVLSKSRMR